MNLLQKREVLPEFLVGTLFEEDDLDNTQGYFNRIARDEKGSKKLHGAFTGGFVAGYKNTVGSEHGWNPTSGFTSKDGKGIPRQMTVLDFMDDEDLVITSVTFREKALLESTL
jgi:hypothetical protein